MTFFLINGIVYLIVFWCTVRILSNCFTTDIGENVFYFICVHHAHTYIQIIIHHHEPSFITSYIICDADRQQHFIFFLCMYKRIRCKYILHLVYMRVGGYIWMAWVVTRPHDDDGVKPHHRTHNIPQSVSFTAERPPALRIINAFLRSSDISSISASQKPFLILIVLT